MYKPKARVLVLKTRCEVCGAKVQSSGELTPLAVRHGGRLTVHACLECSDFALRYNLDAIGVRGC
jgi:hypothetical protein